MSRIEELYERQCDGVLSAEEQTEFAVLLSDGDTLRELTRLMSLHGAIAQAESAARVRSSRRSPSPTSAYRKCNKYSPLVTIAASHE